MWASLQRSHVCEMRHGARVQTKVRGVPHISKEMLIENWRLIIHVHKSRKYTIQSWIAISQIISHDIHNPIYENA